MSQPDLDQVLYTRARWRKAVLIPLWTVQLAVLLGLMGIFAYRLAETLEHYEENDKRGAVPIVELVWEATNVGFNLIALILNIFEIARKATERLTPFTMVCTHVGKLALALAVLALDILAFVQHMDGEYSTIGLALDCGLLAATLAAFIYSLVTYRRLLKYEEYHLTSNAKSNGAYVLPGGDSVELGYNHKAPATINPTEYPRYSDSASYPTHTTGTTSNDQVQNQPLHQQVHRAMGHEFGWDTAPTTTTAAAAANPSSSSSDHVHPAERSGSVVVASGTVAHHGALLPPGELHRQQSWVTERGVIAEMGGDGEDEEEEDDEEEMEEGRVMGRVGGGGNHGEDGEGLLRGAR